MRLLVRAAICPREQVIGANSLSRWEQQQALWLTDTGGSRMTAMWTLTFGHFRSLFLGHLARTQLLLLDKEAN